MKEILFTSEEEKAYRYETFQSDLKYIRIMFLLCIFFYSVFAITDYLTAGDYFTTFLKIRFFLVNPLFAFAIIVSYLNDFYKIHQIFITFVYIVAGIGIIIMLIILPDNFSYYGGLFLIFATGHFLTRMRWHYVLTGSFIIIASFVLTALIYTDKGTGDIVIYAFFYTFFVLICGYGSYTFDQFKRHKYYQTYILTGDKVLLEKKIYDNLIELDNANRITIYSMVKLADSRDSFTGNHIDRVGEYCLKLAKCLDVNIYKKAGIVKAHFIKTIELASVLHDIGKVSIPEAILMKPGRLTEEEMDIMKQHSNIGYETLMQIHQHYDKNDFINMGLDICKFHHERWDGTGYPEGLKQHEIPLSARIVSVIDVYDALISERPYKKAFSKERAFGIIKEESGKMFDPDIVRAFFKCMERHEGQLIKMK